MMLSMKREREREREGVIVPRADHPRLFSIARTHSAISHILHIGFSSLSYVTICKKLLFLAYSDTKLLAYLIIIMGVRSYA